MRAKIFTKTSQRTSIKNRLFLTILSTSLLFLAGCGGDDDDHRGISITPPSECSTIGQNRFVFDVMDQWYYWNNTLPDVDPDTFSSPEALLDQLTSNAPVVDRFSYIADKEASDAFFDAGQFDGLGFTSRNVNNQLFLALVFPGSPADMAGLERGFEITNVNGVDVVTTLNNGNSVDFGASEVGTAVDIEYLDRAGTAFSATILKDTVTIDPVPVSSVIDNNGVATGYLHFYTFIEPSNAALASAFTEFENANVSELVVDVRYNGGGLISVANYLAGLIGGTNTAGEILSERIHNAERAADNDEITFFSDQNHALDLNRVVFITTGGSASASELVINSLTPFLDVVLIGDTTFGKPVGQYGFDFCDSTLFPVSFETVNANDVGGYFDGITVDCPAADDLTTVLGDTAEASLAEALTYLDTDACSPVAATKLTNTKATNKSIEIIQQWKLLDAH